MKAILPVLLALSVVSVCSISAFGDPDTGAAPAPHKGRHAGAGRTKPASTPRDSRSIRGSCTISESQANPLAGPCINSLLILNDADGNEVLKARTSAKGDFEFAVEPKKFYKIASGSRYYEVIAPTTPLGGGARVDLRLRQK